MNLKLTLPTPETHPDFALWRLGYTSEQVYDLFFPREFRFLCNPSRPAVCGRFGLPEDRLWRFEYVVGSSEDGAELASPENVKRIVFPYLTHSGSRYGWVELTCMVQTELQKADTFLNTDSFKMCNFPKIA